MAKIKREIKRKRVGQGSSTLRGTSREHADKQAYALMRMGTLVKEAAKHIDLSGLGGCRTAFDYLIAAQHYYISGGTHAIYRKPYRSRGREADYATVDAIEPMLDEKIEGALEDFRKRCVIK